MRRSLLVVNWFVVGLVIATLCCGSAHADKPAEPMKVTPHIFAPSRPAQDAVREACETLGDLSGDAFDRNRTRDALDAERLEEIGRSAQAKLEQVEELENLSILISCEADKRIVGYQVSDKRRITARNLRRGEAVSLQKFVSFTPNKKIAAAGARLRERVLEAADLLERLEKAAK